MSEKKSHVPVLIPAVEILPKRAASWAVAAPIFAVLTLLVPQLKALSNSTTAITASANPAVWDQSVTFTATVTPGATGTVTFCQDSATGTPLGPPVALSGGQAQLTTLVSRAGSYPVFAVYSGDSAFAPSSSSPLSFQVVAAAPYIEVTVPTANESFVAGLANIEAAIVVVLPSQATFNGTLDFLDNGIQIGSANAVPAGPPGRTIASIVVPLAAGSHVLTARSEPVTDSRGNVTMLSSTSAPISCTAIQPHWPTSVTLSSVPSSLFWKQPVTFTSELIPGPPAVPQVPTGSITFTDALDFPGGITQPLNLFKNSLVAPNLRVGTHSVTASYSGDSNFQASSSSPITVVVSPLGTTTTWVSPAATDRLISGQPLTLSVQVNTAVAGVAVIGSVQFLDGSTPFGSAPVSGGVASLNIPGLAAGPHNFVANFTPGPDTQGDIDFSSSSALTFPVGVDELSSLPQITSGGAWDFMLDAINLGGASAQAHFEFLDDNGNPLSLPLTFPQTRGTGAVTASALDQTLNPGAQIILQSGPAGSNTLVGWGQLQAAQGVGGFGIFSNATYGWNAAVPLETRNATSYFLAFDNTGSLATGVALANVAAQPAGIPVVIRDDTGAQIGTATLNLPGHGHASFMLNQQYPATAGKRGTVEFDRPAGGQISVLGLRGNGPALTTLPVLANVGSGGGSFAHATYNGGFTSAFYLVNTGAVSSEFTLSFLDESGNPLPIPVSLPQTSETITTAALTRTLTAGAMLLVQTQTDESLPAAVGSAALTTSGNISGFEIFRWTQFGQEASVPLETRAANSFVLLFDDTGGLTTGVAVANVANRPETIAVNLRDDTGALLQTTSINLAPQGHTSFMLPDTYQGAANVRGMVEFIVPIFAKISVIGLRAAGDGTLTTIPVLAR